MAFPTINAQQEINNRKILEDIQLKKQQLQKGVAPVVTTIPAISTANSFLNMPHFLTGNQAHSDNISFAFSNPSRAAWNQANTHSFGFFVPQDSVFGNNILPVLPRFTDK